MSLFPDWQAKKKQEAAEKVIAERKPKVKPTRYPVSPDSAQSVWLERLSRCRLQSGYDKRFVRDVKGMTEITERQGLEIARLVYRYRRQLKLDDSQAHVWKTILEHEAKYHSL